MSPFEKELLKVLKNIEKELHVMNRKEELPIKTGTAFIPVHAAPAHIGRSR